MQIRKAERKKAKLRLGLSGPSGSGKTYSALLLSLGLGGKIGMIDTEHGSGDLYAHLGEYDIINISTPFSISRYLEAIHTFEKAGYNTIIIDSLSHAWSGEGGALSQVDKIAAVSKNSYTAWRTVTPEHNSLVDAILQSPAHVIATMRSKTEYVLEENSKGKQAPKKVGLAPIQRDGMEYEFTVFLDISIENIAVQSKDRTGLFKGRYTTINQDTGKELLAWLDAGAEVIPEKNDIDPEAEKSLADAAPMGLDALKEAWGKLTKAQRALLEVKLIHFKEIAASHVKNDAA